MPSELCARAEKEIGGEKAFLAYNGSIRGSNAAAASRRTSCPRRAYDIVSRDRTYVWIFRLREVIRSETEDGAKEEAICGSQASARGKLGPNCKGPKHTQSLPSR